MKRDNKIYFLIFKNILLANSYITSKELASNIGVSYKTIINHMDKVNELTGEYNLKLNSKKSKGFMIEGDPYLKQSIANSIHNVDNRPYFKEERKLFLLHVLLTAYEPLKISYIEYLLHISRTSIYKCISDIEEWLKSYNLIIHKKNYHGIFIERGEKRLRLAIANWCLETESFLSDMKKNNYYEDVLNLQKILNFYQSTLKEELIEDTIDKLQSLIGFKCIKGDLDKFRRVLKISLLRINQNNFVTLSKVKKQRILSLDLNNNIEKIKSLICEKFNIDISNDEATYFFSLILTLDASNVKDSIYECSLSNIDFESLTGDLEYYLNETIIISEELKTEFLKSIQKEVENVLKYQVIHDPTYSLEFSKIKNKYPKAFINALKVFNIIKNHTNIACSEKLITTIIYLLSNLCLKGKQKLKVIFIHNCDIAELEFILLKLNMYLVEVEIVDVYEVSELNSTVNYSNYDLIITTVDFKVIDDIKILKLNKLLSFCDLTYYNSVVHDYYEEINQKKLLILDS